MSEQHPAPPPGATHHQLQSAINAAWISVPWYDRPYTHQRITGGPR